MCADRSCDDLLYGHGLDEESGAPERRITVRTLYLRLEEPRSETKAMLAKTGNRILANFHGLYERDPDFGSVLDKFEGDDEDGVLFAQESFLDEAANALRNRGLTRPMHPELREVSKLFEEAQTRQTQERIAVKTNPHGSLRGTSALNLSAYAREDFQKLIESNLEVQAELLEAVKKRLRQYAYTPESVLFELFQNADDAYAEGGTAACAEASFAVETDDGGMVVLHNGRRVNHGSNPEHQRDLRKMLALNHSDKNTEADSVQVTGRFGLGFKSVFLVTDVPEIVSGRLAVRIVAGAYPLMLDRDRASALRSRAHPETGTAFSLPGAMLSERFRRLAYLLPLFAHRVRAVRVNDETAAWSEDEVVRCGDTRVCVGTLHPLPGVPIGPARALVVRTKTAAVAFGLDAAGFAAFPNDVPTVWVTAPTTECHGVGYLVNAPFDLDVGRSQVTWNSENNKSILRELGQAAGDALIALFDAPNAVFGNADPWRSFWDIVSKSSERKELHDALMWGEAGAARRLFCERMAMPTGLTAEGYGEPTTLKEVKFALVGILDANGELFKEVAEWPGFPDLYSPGTLVSKSRVEDRIKEAWTVVDLAQILEVLLKENPEITPELAASFGRVVTRGHLRYSNELQAVEWSLRPALFRNRAGDFLPASSLLTAVGDFDEAMLGDGKPEHCLHNEYGAEAVEFFLACGGNSEAKKMECIRAIQSAAAQALPAVASHREAAQLPLVPQAATQSSPADALRRIADWWQKNKVEQLAAYDQSIYPDGRLPQVTDDVGKSRGEWLKLFIVGILQSMGRTTSGQNHEFLSLCKTEGWYDALLDRDDGSVAWLRLVEGYIDKQGGGNILYFHWLRHFLGVATVARRLNDYAEAFLAVNRFQGDFAMNALLTTKTSRQFQGGGINAPPLSPILGIGAHFVLRELSRFRLIERHDVHAYSYPPVGRLRRFLSKLGWGGETIESRDAQSRSIHAFLGDHLNDPTFGGSFDIPLLMYAKEHPQAFEGSQAASSPGEWRTLPDGRRIPLR